VISPRQATGIFELRTVSKRYSDETVLQDLDLVIPENRTTVLLGPSGCGKSTLLRLMLGLIWPDHGEVWFEGECLQPQNLRQLRLRMGYVVQEGGLFPHLSARANVSLMASHLQWAATDIRARLEELCEIVQLSTDLLERFPAELSGGQRQRIGLMRALMLDPDVLLLDEPLGALDPMIRSDLQSDLRAIFQKLDKSVVLVTHDLGEAAFLGDEVILLNAGRIVQRGTMAELVNHPAGDFARKFISAQRDPIMSLKQ